MADEEKQNGEASSFGGAPSVVIPKPPTPQEGVKQEIVADPNMVIPHPYSYAGLYNTSLKNYWIYFDEALRNSQANTLAMRRDAYVDELIRHRCMPVIGLPSHFKVDDPEDPDQLGVAQTINNIYFDIPYRKFMLRYLSENSFYGRYGSQLQIGPRKVDGSEWNSVVRHIPVNGDKFRYEWNGTPGLAIYSGSDTTRDYKENIFLEKYSKHIRPSMLGMALFLEVPFLRDRFVIHRFEPNDTDYLFEIEQSQSVFGVGMRSRQYWIWNLRLELLSWMTDALQRVGANGMIYGFFPSGNPQVQQQVELALWKLCKENISAFPYIPGTTNVKDMLQRIEPSSVGYEVMMNLIVHLEEIMRRGYLGQDLSSESKPTGIGGGAAGIHADVRVENIIYDAGILDDTLNADLIPTLRKYNFFKYRGKRVRGDELPFSIRHEFQISKDNLEDKIAAYNTCFQMGVELDKDDVRKTLGVSPPKKKSTILINPQLAQVQQEVDAGTPGVDHLAGALKGLVHGPGKEAQQMGMTGKRPEQQQRPQRSRFSKKPEPVAVLAGKLYLSKSGWGLLKIPNALVRGIFDALHDPGAILPPDNADLPQSKWKLNAHISVLRPEEIESIGGPETVKDFGHHFHYQLGQIKRVNPKGWESMKEVYFIEIDSPELEEMREKYGLSRLPNKNKFKFHVTVAVKPAKKGAGKARFQKSGDCGHDKDGSFSIKNTCSLFSDSIPTSIRRPLSRFYRAYNSTFSSANHAAKLIARKRGMSSEKTKQLGKVLSILDLAGMGAGSAAGAAVGLPFLGKTALGFVPVASGAYLLHSSAKNPLETLEAARRAVKRSLRKIKA
jgi:hypothetical protein